MMTAVMMKADTRPASRGSNVGESCTIVGSPPTLSWEGSSWCLAWVEGWTWASCGGVSVVDSEAGAPREELVPGVEVDRAVVVVVSPPGGSGVGTEVGRCVWMRVDELDVTCDAFVVCVVTGVVVCVVVCVVVGVMVCIMVCMVVCVLVCMVVCVLVCMVVCTVVPVVVCVSTVVL